MAKRSRDKMITFWVTEDELAKINANMEKLGTSNLSAYLRKMAITGLIIRLDIPELKQIVSLMRRTSANINQMAKHINQGDPVAVQQIDGLHEQQEEIWSAFLLLERRYAYRRHSNYSHAHQQRQNRHTVPLCAARLCNQPEQNKEWRTRHRLCLRSAHRRRGVCSIAPPISDLYRANAKARGHRLSGASIFQTRRGYAGGSQCHRLRICQPLFEAELAFDKCQLRKKQGVTRMWLILSFIHFLCCTVSGSVGSFDEGYNYFRNCVLQEIFAQNALSM